MYFRNILYFLFTERLSLSYYLIQHDTVLPICILWCHFSTWATGALISTHLLSLKGIIEGFNASAQRPLHMFTKQMTSEWQECTL